MNLNYGSVKELSEATDLTPDAKVQFREHRGLRGVHLAELTAAEIFAAIEVCSNGAGLVYSE